METCHGEDEEKEQSIHSYATKDLSNSDDVCKCPSPCTCMEYSDVTGISKTSEMSARMQNILGAVSKTESYLKERRIPELIRFLMTKLLADSPDKPILYLEKLLDDCMLYRAGYKSLPILYEERHLKAVIKSFDPGERGWVNADQLRRAYNTLGLNSPKIADDERIPTDELLKNLKNDQEKELHELIMAGSTPTETSGDKYDIYPKNNTPV